MDPECSEGPVLSPLTSGDVCVELGGSPTLPKAKPTLVPLGRRGRRSDALDVMERDGRLDESTLLPEFKAIIVLRARMQSLSSKDGCCLLAGQRRSTRKQQQRRKPQRQIVRATQK
jgi:hypothetical protein